MTEQSITPNRTLLIGVEGWPGEDPETLEQLTLQLADELRLLDGGFTVDRATGGAAAAGSKSGTVETLGELVVSGLGAAVIKGLVSVACAWFDRAKARQVRLSVDGAVLEIQGGSSKAERDSLTAAWLAAVAERQQTAVAPSADAG